MHKMQVMYEEKKEKDNKPAAFCLRYLNINKCKWVFQEYNMKILLASLALLSCAQAFSCDRCDRVKQYVDVQMYYDCHDFYTVEQEEAYFWYLSGRISAWTEIRNISY